MGSDRDSEATAAFKARDYPAASAAYGRLLSRPAEPHHRAAWLLQRSICELRTGNPGGAVNMLAEAAALAPRNGRIRYKYGIALARVARHEDALEQLRASVALSPGVAEHHYRLSLAWRAVGEESEATAALQACLDLDPGHRAARTALANPPSTADQANALAKLGKAAFARQRYPQALDYFLRAAALDPDSAPIEAMLAKAREKLG